VELNTQMKLVINRLLTDIISLFFEITFLEILIMTDLRIILLKNLNKKNRSPA